MNIFRAFNCRLRYTNVSYALGFIRISKSLKECFLVLLSSGNKKPTLIISELRYAAGVIHKYVSNSKWKKQISSQDSEQCSDRRDGSEGEFQVSWSAEWLCPGCWWRLQRGLKKELWQFIFCSWLRWRRRRKRKRKRRGRGWEKPDSHRHYHQSCL